MLKHLGERASDRKFRLFACACCRRIWHRLPDPANCDLVAAVERNPTGTSDEPDLHRALLASSAREYEIGFRDGYLAAKYLGRSFYKCTPYYAAGIVSLESSRSTRADGSIDEEEAQAEVEAQSCLLRDIFGYPYRPVAVASTWLSETVVSLARGIYDDRAFDRLPILGDALEDAGCEEADMLSHCRVGGPHVLGCWPVDLILGLS